MRRDRTGLQALERVDAAVARAVKAMDDPILAFSGGLGSLIVAAMARKRGDLRCVVVGFPGSADVEAAKVAQTFLDYPVSVFQPTTAQALRAARSLAASEPRLPLADILALVPLALVEGRYGPRPVLSGFGLTARSPALRRALQPRRRGCPGLATPAGGSTRAAAVRIAIALGLPEPFALAAPRAPIEGSGIGPALRALGHRERTSLPRLLGIPRARS